MLTTLVLMTFFCGFLLGAFSVAGLFAYLVRQNELEKTLDITMPEQAPKKEVFDQENPKHTILSYT